MDTTSTSSEGGKASRPTRPRSVLQAGEAVLDKAVPPEADGMAVTVQLAGNLNVGRVVGVGGPEHDAAAEDQGLGRGTESVGRDLAE